MHLLKQSTAYTFRLGPFVDSTDGFTAETALTIAATDVFLSKAGGAFAAKNDATAATSTGDARGYYTIVLNTTDTNTLGAFRVHVVVTGALPVWQDFMVLPANVYDSLVAGSAVLAVNSTQFAGTAYATAQAAEAASVWTQAVDGTTTAAESMRLANSANGGKVAGAGTTTVTIRNLADTKDRITATVDSTGNRTTVTRDLT